MLVKTDQPQLFDVLGGCVRFLSSPTDTGADHGFLQGILPSGVVVPLHKHDDPETFYIVEGEMSLFYDDGQTAEWKVVASKELAIIPGGVKHAWWNRSTSACKAIAIVGPSLYRFFEKIAIPASEDWVPGIPDQQRMAAVMEASLQTETWLASPEENIAIGIPMPKMG